MGENKYKTKIWNEVKNSTDDLEVTNCYCHGYDVYKDVLNKSSFSQYILLLVLGDIPTDEQTQLFEKLGIILANPGIRNLSVRAAMNSSVLKTLTVSSLISALSVNSGSFKGGIEIFSLVRKLHEITDSDKFVDCLLCEELGKIPVHIESMGNFDHYIGFEVERTKTSEHVIDSLNVLYSIKHDGLIGYLYENYESIEQKKKLGISMTLVVACSMIDIGLSGKQSELLFLWIQLIGAGIHSLEQFGKVKDYPFFNNEISYN